MISIKKKSRKNLYGLVAENLEDITKKNIATIYPVKFDEQKNKISSQEKEEPKIKKCVPLVLEKLCCAINQEKLVYSKEKSFCPRIRKSKITISYHKYPPKKKFYGSKTGRVLSKYFESYLDKYEYYFKSKKKKTQIH